MTTNNFELARSLQAQLAWLAVNGKSITLKELGVRLTEVDDLYTKIYVSVGSEARLQHFLKT